MKKQKSTKWEGKNRLNTGSKPLLIAYENGLLGCTKVAMCSHLVCTLQLWFCNKNQTSDEATSFRTHSGKSGWASISHPEMLPQSNSWKRLDYGFITGGSKLIGPSDVTSTVCGEVILLESDLLSSPQQLPFHSVPIQAAHKKVPNYVKWSTWVKLCQKYDSLMYLLAPTVF